MGSINLVPSVILFFLLLPTLCWALGQALKILCSETVLELQPPTTVDVFFQALEPSSCLIEACSTLLSVCSRHVDVNDEKSPSEIRHEPSPCTAERCQGFARLALALLFVIH